MNPNANANPIARLGTFCAIDPHANYKVAFKETYDVKEERTMSGADLAKLRVEILDAPVSLLVAYENSTHLAAAPL